MDYTINIALNKRHYARVELPDTRVEHAKSKLADFRNAFPMAQGFDVTMTLWTRTGETVE